MTASKMIEQQNLNEYAHLKIKFNTSGDRSLAKKTVEQIHREVIDLKNQIDEWLFNENKRNTN